VSLERAAREGRAERCASKVECVSRHDSGVQWCRETVGPVRRHGQGGKEVPYRLVAGAAWRSQPLAHVGRAITWWVARQTEPASVYTGARRVASREDCRASQEWEAKTSRVLEKGAARDGGTDSPSRGREPCPGRRWIAPLLFIGRAASARKNLNPRPPSWGNSSSAARLLEERRGTSPSERPERSANQRMNF